jgi:hypothetical protein
MATGDLQAGRADTMALPTRWNCGSCLFSVIAAAIMGASLQHTVTGAPASESRTPPYAAQLQPASHLDQFSLLQAPLVPALACTDELEGHWKPIPPAVIAWAEPGSRYQAFWTGTDLLVWGGSVASSARFNPASDSWSPVSSENAPDPRRGANVLWTGKELLVWGGRATEDYWDDGARYDPKTDRWAPMSRVGAPTPGPSSHALWIGQEMIVWTSTDRTVSVTPAVSSTRITIQGRYDPQTDVWTTSEASYEVDDFSYVNAALWSGTEVILWARGERTVRGMRWNPSSDSWTATSDVGALATPPVLAGWNAVLAGDQVLLWTRGRGQNNVSVPAGAVYSFSLDAWSPMNVDGLRGQRRENESVVWTGREMLVWGGADTWFPCGHGHCLQQQSYSDGMAYIPGADAWRMIPAGSARQAHAAVWTGSQMMVFGGVYTSGPQPTRSLTDGAAYTPPC